MNIGDNMWIPGIKKQKSNLTLPTIALGLFIICFIIIGAAYITSLSEEISGWNFVFAVWVSMIPLFISFILSIVSVIKYSSDEKTTGSAYYEKKDGQKVIFGFNIFYDPKYNTTEPIIIG